MKPIYYNNGDDNVRFGRLVRRNSNGTSLIALPNDDPYVGERVCITVLSTHVHSTGTRPRQKHPQHVDPLDLWKRQAELHGSSRLVR